MMTNAQNKQLKKQLKVLVYTIVILCIAVAFAWMRMAKQNSLNSVEQEIGKAVTLMRENRWQELEPVIEKINKTIPQITDYKLRSELFETSALIEMLFLAKTDREEDALKVFATRFSQYKGKKIPIAYYDELLPYAKFHLLNLFLKRYDMTGAYYFVNSYPAVTNGKHVDYFAAMDLFANNRVDEALGKLELLTKAEPENRMYKGSISYIQRFNKKNMESKENENKVENK